MIKFFYYPSKGGALEERRRTMTVTYKEYMEEKTAFFKKHDHDFTVKTSPMDEYDRYHKTYVFEDGAEWCETMGSDYANETIEVKKAKVKVEIKLFRTEFWSSETGSKYYYEAY